MFYNSANSLKKACFLLSPQTKYNILSLRLYNMKKKILKISPYELICILQFSYSSKQLIPLVSPDRNTILAKCKIEARMRVINSISTSEFYIFSVFPDTWIEICKNYVFDLFVYAHIMFHFQWIHFLLFQIFVFSCGMENGMKFHKQFINFKLGTFVRVN